MDASSIEALAPTRLCHHPTTGPSGRPLNQSSGWLYSLLHRLIRAKVAIRIAPKHRKQQTSRRKLDVGKLKDLETSNQFKRDLQERLLSKPDDNLTVEEHWTHVKTALTDACKEAIGFKTKRHQDWFNENDKEIKRLIESKRQAFTDWQTHRHCNTRKAKYSCRCPKTDSQYQRQVVDR